MSNKRFVLNNNGDDDSCFDIIDKQKDEVYTFINEICALSDGYDIVNLLNSLSEENEQLKEYVGDVEADVKHYQKEIEILKNDSEVQSNELENDKMMTVGELIKKLEKLDKNKPIIELLNNISEENEELKTEDKRLNNIIIDLYDKIGELKKQNDGYKEIINHLREYDTLLEKILFEEI